MKFLYDSIVFYTTAYIVLRQEGRVSVSGSAERRKREFKSTALSQRVDVKEVYSSLVVAYLGPLPVVKTTIKPGDTDLITLSGQGSVI